MHERRPLKSMSGPFAPQKVSARRRKSVNLRHHLADGGGIVRSARPPHAQRRSHRRRRGRMGLSVRPAATAKPNASRAEVQPELSSGTSCLSQF
jgi:hypothetical protein